MSIGGHFASSRLIVRHMAEFAHAGSFAISTSVLWALLYSRN